MTRLANGLHSGETAAIEHRRYNMHGHRWLLAWWFGVATGWAIVAFAPWQSHVHATGSDDGLPRGAVVAFNLDACPAGWSAADGTSGQPDLRGRFPIGAGSLPDDPGVTITRGAFGGSHQVRVLGLDNQFQCCNADQGLGGVGIEWSHEGGNYYEGANDDNHWSQGKTNGTAAAPTRGEARINTDGQPWLNHLPPFWGVLYCVKTS